MSQAVLPGFSITVPGPQLSQRRSRFVLPTEAVADVISFLDRMSIERALMVGRQFNRAADHLLTSGNVPLRFFDSAGIGFRIDGRCFFLANLNEEVQFTFDDPDVWAYVTRWSAVTETGIHAYNFETPLVTSSVWDRFIGCVKMMASAEEVQLCNVNLCPLSPGQLKQLSTFNFLQKILFDRCLMLSTSIDNEFLRLISEHREHDLTLCVEDSVPCDRATFAVDDDGILQFLCSGEGKYERKLEICHATATEQLPVHLESAFAAIQGEPQVQLTLVPRHPNHELVIDATNRFTRVIGAPPGQVLYVHDESPMTIWLVDTRLTPSLGVMLHPQTATE